MPIAKGTRFGPYLIVAPLGEGGMGEVYRAEDTRLGRPVAVKVLPDGVAREPTARARFEREARLIGSLQHPGICVLHDVGFHGDAPFLVMELLTGETLEARLARGRLTRAASLRVGARIADALEAAHRHGVVHRDLKPANVMLLSSAEHAESTDVKLLDFGIARPMSAGAAPDRLTSASSIADRAGVATASDALALVGTLPYMAPEQISGHSLDQRTDIWALGCVLYEMLSGASPFRAATTAELVAAILERPLSPLSERAPDLSPHLSHLVMRCLERDPERRWQSSRDIAEELEWAGRGEVASAAAAPRKRTTRVLAWSGWAAAAVLAAAGAVSFSTGRRATPTPSALVRLAIPSPPDTSFFGGRSAPYLALSPDGRTLALVPTPFRRSAGIWLRDLEDPNPRQLPDTVGATYPFWSPDGTRLGFFADGKLKTIDVKGGRPLTICDAPASRGGTWSASGDILFTPRLDSAIYRVAAAGGTPVAVTTLDAARGEFNHKLPTLLPDGRRFLFVMQAARSDRSGLYLGSVDSPAVQQLAATTSRAEYSRGFLWYARDGSLVAHAFDLSSGRLSGEPVSASDDVASRNTIIGDAVFSVAATGVVAVWSGQPFPTTELTWYDRSGRRVGTIGDPDRHFSVALAPDEQTIAIEVPDREGPFYNVWTVDVASGVKTRLTSGSLNWGPVWSPDGQRVAYGSTREGPSHVWLRGLSASGESRAWASRDFTGPTGWMPNGSGLVLLDATHYRVGLLQLASGAAPRWISEPGFVEGDGRPSPDGRWLAYTSNESGSWDVYLKPLPSLDRKWRVSRAGGSGPAWRPDSSELYFVDPEQRLMAVPIQRGGVPVGTAPAPLFSLPVVPTPPGIDPRQLYAPTRRGDRFLVNQTVEQGNSPPITIVLNLTERLRPFR